MKPLENLELLEKIKFAYFADNIVEILEEMLSDYPDLTVEDAFNKVTEAYKKDLSDD